MNYFTILSLIIISIVHGNKYENDSLSDHDSRFIFLSTFLKAFSNKFLIFLCLSYNPFF